MDRARGNGPRLIEGGEYPMQDHAKKPAAEDNAG